MEIERKYLVKTLPSNLDNHELLKIEQGYLCTFPTIRIRKMNNRYILTYKSRISTQSSAIHNHEVELPLTEESFLQLKKKCDGIIIQKDRYIIPLGNGLKAELDIFHGEHEGLILVEVEFPDTITADTFSKPEWFGEDVSLDPRYRNSYLSSIK